MAVASKRPFLPRRAGVSGTHIKLAHVSSFTMQLFVTVVCRYTSMHNLNKKQRQSKLPSQKGRPQSYTCPQAAQRPRLIAPHTGAGA